MDQISRSFVGSWVMAGSLLALSPSPSVLRSSRAVPSVEVMTLKRGKIMATAHVLFFTHPTTREKTLATHEFRHRLPTLRSCRTFFDIYATMEATELRLGRLEGVIEQFGVRSVPASCRFLALRLATDVQRRSAICARPIVAYETSIPRPTAVPFNPALPARG